ncbi:hypothetical protein EV121DRAFT_266619 [Schizophyllum commune]
MAQKIKAGKNSSNNYPRHVAAYVKFWEDREFSRAQQDSAYISGAAHPITVTKACIFLKYECERPKRSLNGQDIPGSHVGLEHVKQCINTYKTSDLKRMSLHCLKGYASTSKIVAALRDRCMLLLSAYTAFRGDSARMLLLSDIGAQDVNMPEIAEGATVMAMILLRDQGKHIQDGRVEEHAALRHRDVELCCVGAMALYLFALFHIAGNPRPVFAPDFSSTEADHLARTNNLHAQNGVQISAKTHAGRHYAAKNMRDNRASRPETKAVGKWSMNGDGAYDRYDHSLPIEGMLAAASFNARHPEAYMILRNSLDLLVLIFPWVEEEVAAMEERRRTHGSRADDYALKNFLDFLRRARRILVQDAACIYSMDATCDFLRFPPFNTTIFQQFALSSVGVIQQVEQAHRTNIHNLPAHLSDAFRGVVAQFSAEQRLMQAQFAQRLNSLESACIGALEPKTKRARKLSPQIQTTALPTFNPGVFVSQPAPLVDPIQRQRDDALRRLKNMYGEDHLAHHQWTWIQSTTAAPSRWVPTYRFARTRSILDATGCTSERPVTVDDIWEEHIVGLDGHLSISQLNAEWGSEWRRGNNSEKSEATRRGRIVELVTKLSQRPNWNSKLALKFLAQRYPIGHPPFRTLRQFVEYIQKKDKETGRHPNFDLVLQSAETYHGSN